MMVCERGATRATLSAYETDLRNFYEFLQGQRVEETTLTTIQDYLITQSHLSRKTVARKMSSLRQFYTFLKNRGLIKENPFSFMKVVPFKSPSIPPLSSTYVESLWEGAKTWAAPEGKRLFLLMQILQATDKSVKEIISLPFPGGLGEDISLYCHQNAPLKVLSYHQSLQDYLKIRSYFLTNGQASPWLFPSSSRKGHLTPQRLGQLLKELGSKLGIDAKLISLSTFRNGLRYFNKI